MNEMSSESHQAHLNGRVVMFEDKVKKTGTLNRIRVVLAEQEKANRWLAEKLGKTEHTISRWCHNKSQPSVAQLNEIANVLNVDVRTLMNSNL